MLAVPVLLASRFVVLMIFFLPVGGLVSRWSEVPFDPSKETYLCCDVVVSKV